MFPLGVVLLIFGYAIIYWAARGLTYPNAVNRFTDILGFTATTEPSPNASDGGFGDVRTGGGF